MNSEPNVLEYDPDRAKLLLNALTLSYTPKELAAFLNVSERTYYAYINGETKLKYPQQFLLEELRRHVV